MQQIYISNSAQNGFKRIIGRGMAKEVMAAETAPHLQKVWDEFHLMVLTLVRKINKLRWIQDFQNNEMLWLYLNLVAPKASEITHM